MSGQIYWIVDAEVREGKLDELKALRQEMVEATKANEPGTVNYEWTVTDDHRRLTIFERYTDSAAAVVHLKTFMKNYAARFMGCLDVKKVVVHGTPSEELKKIQTGMGAKFMSPFGGFSR